MTKQVSKAMEQVFGAALEANATYDIGTKVDGAYPAQIRKGKTGKDKAKGHVPNAKHNK